MTTLLWVLGMALSISFLCSILEAVLLSITHSYAAVLREKDPTAGRWMEAMQRKIDEPIAAILTLNTIAHTLGATYGGALATEILGDDLLIFLFGVALTLAILLFSEILPKTLGATYWQTLGRPTAYVLRAMVVVMKPIVLPLALFNRMISPRREHPTVSRAELEVLAEIGRREGTLDEAEWKVVSNIMRLEDILVGEVMTPRTDMVAIPENATVAEAKNVMLDEGRLRLPVYDDNLDDITGILLARDLWRADRDGVESIRDIIRPIHFAPSSKRVEDLIPEMRMERVKMAIVVDEFGGTAGLVTLEDLIEEIIGEIQDEHEADEPVDFQPLDGGDVRVWGGVPLREVNERLDLDLPAEQHDTLGGFVFGKLNRVGKAGDVIEVEGGEFRITRMRGRRIEYTVFRPDRSRGREVTAAD